MAIKSEGPWAAVPTPAGLGSEERPRGDISPHLAAIEQELKMLHEGVEELSQRIKPVLMPQVDVLKEPGPDKAGPQSPMANQLQHYWQSILEVRERIQAINRGLGL